MYIRVYLCCIIHVYVCTYVYLCLYSCIYTCISLFLCMSECVSLCMCTCVYLCLFFTVHIYTFVFMCIFTCIHVYMYIGMFKCVISIIVVPRHSSCIKAIGCFFSFETCIVSYENKKNNSQGLDFWVYSTSETSELWV